MKKLLIIDDSRTVQQVLLTEMLGLYFTSQADSIRQAEMLHEDADVLVIDAILPDNGRNFTHIKRYAELGKPTVCYTSLGPDDMGDIGNATYIPKSKTGKAKLLEWLKDKAVDDGT